MQVVEVIFLFCYQSLRHLAEPNVLLKEGEQILCKLVCINNQK